MVELVVRKERSERDVVGDFESVGSQCAREYKDLDWLNDCRPLHL